MKIETANLQLFPFSPKHLLALIDGVEQFKESFGLGAAEGLREFFVSDEVSPNWLAQLRASESADPWVHGFAIVDKQSNLVIGSIGFKGAPDEAGMVEIAYGVVPVFQGRGFATEAAAAGVSFAFDNSKVCLIRAHTLPENLPSSRVLEKCGFTYRGQVIDPEDGLVWRWERNRELV